MHNINRAFYPTLMLTNGWPTVKLDYFTYTRNKLWSSYFPYFSHVCGCLFGYAAVGTCKYIGLRLWLIIIRAMPPNFYSYSYHSHKRYFLC